MADPPDGRQQARTFGGAKHEGLRGDLEMLRRHWRLIAGVMFASVVVFVIAHERSAKTYTATASVAFQSDTLTDAALNIATVTSSEPQREADTEVLIAHSTEVARAVHEQLKLGGTSNELLGEVKVEAAANADVLNILATTRSPQASATLANAFAAQYIAFRTKAQLAGISTAQEKVREQMAVLPAASPERATLEQSLVRLGSLQAAAASGTNIIGRATPPTSPDGAGVSESIVIGLLVGAAIAFTLIFLLESLDRRVKTIADFERGYGLPVLVGIPRASSSVLDHRSSGLLEPYRILRTALSFSAVTRQLNTLLVTSAIADEGKTTVAVNLAQVIAMSGRRAVLVELDLRRPATFDAIDLAAKGGATTAIAGAAEVRSLLTRPLADLPNLLVLPSGALPHNPSELLGSARVTEMLMELAVEDSMVIIDSPPLNPVADAQVLLDNPAIDGVLLVAQLDRTTRDEVRHARAIIDRHKLQAVGVAVTGVREPGRYGYGGYESASVAGELKIKVPTHRAGRRRESKIVDEYTDGAPEQAKRTEDSKPKQGATRGRRKEDSKAAAASARDATRSGGAEDARRSRRANDATRSRRADDRTPPRRADDGTHSRRAEDQAPSKPASAPAKTAGEPKPEAVAAPANGSGPAPSTPVARPGVDSAGAHTEASAAHARADTARESSAPLAKSADGTQIAQARELAAGESSLPSQPTGASAPTHAAPPNRPTRAGAPTHSTRPNQPTGPSAPTHAAPPNRPTGPSAPTHGAPPSRPTGASAPTRAAPPSRPTGRSAPTYSAPAGRPADGGAPKQTPN